MRLDRAITLGLVHPLRQMAGLSRSPSSDLRPLVVPILMYHNITDAPEPGVAPYYQVNTSPAVFAQHMQFLADHGYKTITISELVSLLRSGSENCPPSTAPWPRPTADCPPSTVHRPPSTDHRPLVVLTFDDGFSSVYSEAYRVMRKHGFTATIYLATSFIGDTPQPFRPAGSPRSLPTVHGPQATVSRVPTSDLRSLSSALCLSWPQVREMHQAGMEFGSHTVTHPKLVELTRDQIRSELCDSRAELENRLQSPITQFCYPYAFPGQDGEFTKRFTAVLKESGYTCCTTTELGRARIGDDPFRLKRLPANTLDDVQLFGAKLAGSYDWLNSPQALAKRVKSLAKRRHRRPVSPGADPSRPALTAFC